MLMNGRQFVAESLQRTTKRRGHAHLAPSVRTRAVAALLLAAGFCLAGCGGNEEPQSRPRATPTTAPNTASSSATPDPNAWRNKYTPEQLAAYDQALARFTAYEHQSEPIWAAGKATPAAEALFKSYFPSPLWQSYFQRLQTYEQVDVSVAGLPTVLWSRAKAIGSDSQTISLLQCVNVQSAVTTQYGKPIARQAWSSKPVIRTAQLDRPAGFDWLIYQLNEPTDKNHKSCEANQ